MGTPKQDAKMCRAVRRGFSLMEMLAVVSIIAVIALVVIPRIMGSREKSLRAVALQGQDEIRRAIERSYFDNGGYPPDGNAFMHDTGYCDPGLTGNDFSAFVDAGYWYTYEPATGKFNVTQNGQPIN